VQLIIDDEWDFRPMDCRMDGQVQGYSEDQLLLFLLCPRRVLEKDEDDGVFKGFPSTNCKLTVDYRRWM
jgi:hypothetical protein